MANSEHGSGAHGSNEYMVIYLADESEITEEAAVEKECAGLLNSVGEG